MPEWPFEPAFLQQLERLRLYAYRSPDYARHGDRTLQRKGQGTDFVDFRPYAPGDDLRYIDWNMFARLDKLILKEFQAEGNLCLHLLIDTSDSMGTGSPTKLDYALRAAAALAYLSLMNNEHVALGLFNRSLYKVAPPTHGRKRITPLLRFLSDTMPSGTTDISASLTSYARQSPRAGVAILISDLLDSESDFRPGLAALIRRRFEVRILHVLAREEVHPELHGDLRLVDIERSDVLNVTADSEEVLRYEANLNRFREEIETYSHSRGIAYHAVTNDTPFEDLIFSSLRKRRFLQ